MWQNGSLVGSRHKLAHGRHKLTCPSSTIIADFDNIYEDDPTKRLAYWYFNFNQEKTQVLDIMLRSIIRQLCPNPVPKYVIKLWKEHCPQGREPTQRLLLGVLEQILESSPGSTFLILDALDECPERPGNQARETLLNLLNELIERHRPILHILATSRPEYDIRFHLGKHQTFDIEEGLSEDVERFVNDRLEQGKLKEWLNQNPLLKEKIREKLLSVEKPYVFLRCFSTMNG
jgi:hypothetical protein